MIKSMTGYGQATGLFNQSKINIEIKSVNGKFLELMLKLPKGYSEKELLLRGELSRLTDRGKMNVSITLDNSESGKALINKELAKVYYQQLKELAAEVMDEKADLLRISLSMPDVLKSPDDSVPEEEWNAVYPVFLKAVEQFNKFREDEGKILEKDLSMRIDNILNYLSEVDQFENTRIEMVREKLNQYLINAVSAENVDRNRLEQELIYYIEKFDITEEKIRLKAHCDYFLLELQSESSGKKLGFISQEIGREINTLGSKANHSDIQKIVVNMKDELEKIKEQLLNVL